MARLLALMIMLSLAILISGCVNPLPGKCQPQGESCCKWDVCTVTDASCVQGTQPIFSGCDEKCMPIVRCVPMNSD